ncbi:MAG: hypothetical protein R3E01_25875 [Pirellulaceae bacterium]|nr:hypothetical protein [Planctomycetales bacterium]
MVRFVILAAPRTGSNLLCSLLDSHPEILCHHEVFNPAGIFLSLTQREQPPWLPSMTQREADRIAFLDHVWATGSEHRCVGFKWTRGQSPEVLHHVLHDRAIVKIVLRRRNRIKTYVSAEIAKATAQWEVYDAADLSQPRPKVTIRDQDLRAHIADNERMHAEIDHVLNHTRQSSVLAFYEDLFRPAIHHQLLVALGVQDAECALSASSVKQNSTDLRYSVANFAELAVTLAGSDLETELFDVGL